MDGDADLVARVRRGDRQALDDLYDRYANDVFSMCLVVLGDPTVARAAAGTAFALVARTRMNPLSDPSRLRSWLLELARGSVLAWSGSPQARSVPVPHGVSAEAMIEGAVVPAPASLRAGLARTFDRASSAAAHERAVKEHLAARDAVPQPRTTETPTTAPGTARDPAIPLARTVATPGHGLAAAQPAASGGPAGEATRPAGEQATAHGHQAQTTSTSAATAGDAAGTGDAAATGRSAGAVQPARTAGRFSRKAAGHGTRPGGHQAAADQPAPTAESGLGVSQPVQLVKRSDATPDGAGVDPPTVSTGLPSNVVPLGAAYQDGQHGDHQHDSHQHYYADGQGAPLVPIDDLEAHCGRAAPSDWRTRPAIAVAASLVVAVAGITAALNWPTPSANLSAENFPDAAIVAPSLAAKPSASTRATAAAPTSPPEATPASTIPPAIDVTHAQPRPVVNQRVIATTTPRPAGAGDAPTPPPATPSTAPTTPSSPPRTPPVSGTPTPSPTGPAHTSPPPVGAPTSPVATQSAATTQPVRPSQSAAAVAPTAPAPPRPTVVGTLNSGSTANM